MKKILIASAGTLGDVTPVHFLAKKLREAGNTVEFALEEAHADLCKTFPNRKLSTQNRSYNQKHLKTIGEILDPNERANYFLANLLKPFWTEYTHNLKKWSSEFSLVLCNGLLNPIAETLSRSENQTIFSVWYCGPDPEHFQIGNWQNNEVPRILAYSPALSNDIPINGKSHKKFYKTGFWMEAEPAHSKLIYDLFVSFGSSNRAIPTNLVAALNTLATKGKKIAIHTNQYSGRFNALIEHFDGFIDHNYLINASKAIIHQAGSGIVSKSLYFGKPSIVFPFWGDQYSWANLLQYKKLTHGIFNPWSTEEKIYDAIENCLTSTEVTGNCKKIGETLQLETGLQQGVTVISELLKASPKQ